MSVEEDVQPSPRHQGDFLEEGTSQLRQNNKPTTTDKGDCRCKGPETGTVLIYQIMALPCWCLALTGHFAQGLVLLKTSALPRSPCPPPGGLELPEVS